MSDATGTAKRREQLEPMQADLLSILDDAASSAASDIHIALEGGKGLIQFRVHGVVVDVEELEGPYCQDLMLTAFNMADTGDATYNAFGYSSGRISRSIVELPRNVESVRLQFNPLANYGRYLVMRLLYRSTGVTTRDLSRFGFTKMQQRQIRHLRATPMGVIVIAGPTGSGKSTSARLNLELLLAEREQEIAVLSVEDPPEAPIKGVRQIPVTSARGAESRKAKFDEAILSALRSDPDVILIGEIRDKESGELATQAAMTGHQVWSTLHALNALAIPNRLRDLGVEPFKIFDASILTGLWGQRLVKRLCTNCRVPFRKAKAQGQMDPDFVEHVESILDPDEFPLYRRGPGCARCKRGVVGRLLIAEVVMPDQRLMNLLREGDMDAARMHWVTKLQGFTMHDHALTHVARGIIAPEEYETTLGPMQRASNPAFLHRLKAGEKRSSTTSGGPLQAARPKQAQKDSKTPVEGQEAST